MVLPAFVGLVVVLYKREVVHHQFESIKMEIWIWMLELLYDGTLEKVMSIQLRLAVLAVRAVEEADREEEVI